MPFRVVDASHWGGATVWHYSENTIDFDRFDSIDSFVDANSSKAMSVGVRLDISQNVTLAKSYSDILSAKRAGKVAMVVGVQDMWPLEWAWRWTWPADKGPNDYIPNPSVTDLSEVLRPGASDGQSRYQLSNSFGGGLLDPTTPLSVAGKYIVDQMQEIGILVDCSHSSDQTSLDIIRRAKRTLVCSHSNVLALNDVANLPVLRPELLRRGYSFVDIAKIFGGNWMHWACSESWRWPEAPEPTARLSRTNP